MWYQILLAIVGGAAGAALINQVGESLRERRRRKVITEDRESSDMAVVKLALKWVLYDRIRFLGQAFLREGEIDFDDRRLLNEMHRCYHDGLGGNGDLNVLMEAVNNLPLRQ